MPRVDGLWELGLLTVKDADLGTALTLKEEDIAPEIALWVIATDANRQTVTVPITVDDINRMDQWMTKARQNNVERKRRAGR